LEVLLDSINHVEESQCKAFGGVAAGKLGDPSDASVRSLTGLLGNSTIGVALFDRNLHCKAFNGALRSMMRVSAKKHIGKHLHQLFHGGVPNLELAFRRVWNSGNSLSNLELTAQVPAATQSRRWLANIYPIRDESRQVRLVATTFSEITRGRCVELKLSRLRDKFQSDVLREPNLLEEEFSALSARTFELVNRSVTLLRTSLSLRFYTSEIQLEAALVRRALFMKANRPQEWIFCLQSTVASGSTPTHTPESSGESTLTCNSPSPRERQILCLLADGKSNKEIGSILDISTRTVECYRARIMLKLDLHSTAALVRYAVRNKIVEA
jgi:DNA-binding CsgD family transcriptional regulator